MSWNSPSVVSNLFGFEGSAAFFCESRLLWPRRCTTKRIAMTHTAMSTATMMSMTARAEDSDFTTRIPW